MISFFSFLESEKAKKASIFALSLGLICFLYRLTSYAWTIITTPYPEEYREGAVLLLTDFLIHKINPFSLANHPLMTNNYGFLYNLVVLPFAITFGNTLAVHRAISIFFVLACCVLIVLILNKVGNSLSFAFAGGLLVMGSWLFAVTPLARPDSMGEFFFLITILLPWYRKFDTYALMGSGLAGILAFLVKPYFFLAVVIVALYVFIFISKKKGSFYALLVLGVLTLILGVINVFLECYFLDVILNNVANSKLSNSYMLQQLAFFIEIFLPCFLILLLAAVTKKVWRFSNPVGPLKKQPLNFSDFGQPLSYLVIDYFGFFLACTSILVVFWLGKHSGAYMSYFFQLVTPGLILVVFQRGDVLYQTSAITVPLLLINLALICFWVLYPNRLSVSQQQAWEKLYGYVDRSTHLLNSPVLVPEMIRLNMLPVDSGQSEFFFNNELYAFAIWAPDYQEVNQQGRKYLNSIRTQIQNQKYDRIMVTAKPGLSPFAGHALIDQFYERVELIRIEMPQTGQYWTIEVNEPQHK